MFLIFENYQLFLHCFLIVVVSKLVIRIDGSRRMTRRYRRFLRLYNQISTSIDINAFHGWRQDQPCSQGDNISHQSPLMFSYHSSDVRIDETNEADGDHINVEGEHTTALLFQ